jgi:hypothetical protein
MEESVLHVKLMNGPIPGVSQGEDIADSCRFDNRAECFVIVNTGALSKSAKNPTNFVPVERTISVKLVSENPFAGDHICLRRTLKKVPSMVVVKGSTFFFHGLTPVWVSQSITEGAWEWGEYFGVQTNLWLQVPRFAASRHAVGVDDQRDGDGTCPEWRAMLDVARGGGRDEAPRPEVARSRVPKPEPLLSGIGAREPQAPWPREPRLQATKQWGRRRQTSRKWGPERPGPREPAAVKQMESPGKTAEI